MDEITAEYEVSTLLPAAELVAVPKVTYGCKTDMGRVRENNEDKFEVYLPEADNELASRGLIFLVCDGMGGHEAGQIASELAAKTFIDVYLSHPSTDPEVAARHAVQAANRFILDVARAVSSRKGMGTTLSALLLIQDQALIVQVGDSRVYRVRGDKLEPVTTDHTWVEETVAAGIMPRAQAEAHQYRHMLTRAVGTEPQVAVDCFWHDLEAGDQFLLCSDGVTNHVSDDALETLLTSSPGPSAAALRTVQQALVGGGSDNATAIVVRVDAIQRRETA